MYGFLSIPLSVDFMCFFNEKSAVDVCWNLTLFTISKPNLRRDKCLGETQSGSGAWDVQHYLSTL